MARETMSDGARYPYEVRVAPGCHGKPVAPLISRHRTLRAAVARARKSNRLVVERSARSGIVWRASQYRDIGLGPGLYGQPDVRTLAECLREAEASSS